MQSWCAASRTTADDFARPKRYAARELSLASLTPAGLPGYMQNWCAASGTTAAALARSKRYDARSCSCSCWRGVPRECSLIAAAALLSQPVYPYPLRLALLPR